VERVLHGHDDVPRAQVSSASSDSRLFEDVVLAGLDGGERRAKTFGRFDGEQHGLTIGQELGPAMSDFVLFSMHDTGIMGQGQSIGNLGAVFERVVAWEWPLRQSIGEVLPLDVLHDEEVDPALVSDVEKGTDVCVVQL